MSGLRTWRGERWRLCLVVTCEHGGNEAPDAYAAAFAGARDLLDGHQGYDPGTRELAGEIAAALDAPLHAATVSRLVVELNRSPHHRALFSEFTRGLAAETRRENVEYKNGPLKGALAVLKDKDGDCEELTSLFIALCRAGDVPARTVWVPGHCYPEFYLVDRAGEGHWFPCQAAGSRAFGGIPEHRPILQKGDSFRDVDRPRQRMRYLSEFLTGKAIRGGGQPSVRFIREDVATDAPLDDTATDISPIRPAEDSKNEPAEDRDRPRFDPSRPDVRNPDPRNPGPPGRTPRVK